jgi:hypothetical protein
MLWILRTKKLYSSNIVQIKIELVYAKGCTSSRSKAE